VTTPIYYDQPLVCAGANGWIISEDFVSISGVGSTGWTVTPTGASAGVFAIVPPVGDAAHPGVVRVATGTTATGRVALSRGASRLRLPAGVPLARLTMEALVRVPVLPDAVQNYSATIGLVDSTVLATGAAEIGWRLTLAGAWVAVCRIGGVDVVASSVLPAVAGQWTRLRLDYSASEGAAWSAASPSPGPTEPLASAVSAVVDPLVAASLTPAVKVFKTVGTTNREIEVDYLYASQYAPGAR
jgi:hypothetical protein